MSEVKVAEDITHYFCHLAAEKDIYTICPSSCGKEQQSKE